MHDNSRKSFGVVISSSSSLDADRFTADHPESSAHISLLKFSDASDSDSSGESEEKSKLFSRACAMRMFVNQKFLTKQKHGRMGSVMWTVNGRKFVLVSTKTFV